MDDLNTELIHQSKTIIIDDSVNHPSHYTQGDIECIDAIQSSMSRDAFIGYLKGNCIKYLWRAGLKDDAVEDVRKAEWYLNKLEEVLEDGEANA